MNRRPLRAVLFVAALATMLALRPTTGWTQKPVAGSAVPNLNAFLPIGLQRGQAVELALTGINLAGPTGLSLGMPADATFPTGDKNGLDNAKLKVQLKLPADAPLGLVPLRVATKYGISNVRLAAIDDLPQVVENGKNNTRETAQPISVPSGVSGRVDAEKADYFKLTAAAGQRLSFDVLGRRLGGPIDPQIAVYHAKTGREVAFDNDAPGCQGDPRLSVVFKEAGEYLAEIKDVLNRGGPDYVYYLRVGDFPLATTPFPMAARRGSTAKVTFTGPAVDGVVPVDVNIPADPAVTAVWVTPKNPSGLSGWPVALAVSDHEERTEAEPNNEPATANRVTLPVGITGRFHQSDDTDCYVFTAKKGQKLAIEAQTLDLFSPSLVYMVLKNAKTKAEVAKSNPQALPPGDQRFELTAPEDGDYVLEVQHLTFAGGPSEVYRVTIVPSVPGFDLVLPGERFDLAPGSFAPALVQVTRRGYAGPIDLSLVGPPGLTGMATIKAGQTTGVVIVNAKPDVKPGPYVATILGKASIDGRPITQPASARAALSAALNGLPYPPLNLNTQIALGVRDKAPFTLAVKMNPPDGIPGTKPQITLTVQRDAGFADEIAILAPTNLPPTVPAPKVPNIPKGKNEVAFPLDVTAKAPLGEYGVLFSAKAKTKAGDVAVAALPLDLVLAPPFALTIDPPLLALKPGEKAKLKITATRRGGYKGPIAIEARKLPANVTGGKATIAADQAATELEITAAPTAPAGDKTDVDVIGTATALANLQNASPAFTVRVQKK